MSEPVCVGTAFHLSTIDRPTSRETQWMEHWPPCKSTPQKEQSKQRKSRQENNQNLTDKQAREKKLKIGKKKMGRKILAFCLCPQTMVVLYLCGLKLAVRPLLVF